jgi:uncharacterized membrane protein YhaH (DUF805 family)
MVQYRDDTNDPKDPYDPNGMYTFYQNEQITNDLLEESDKRWRDTHISNNSSTVTQNDTSITTTQDDPLVVVAIFLILIEMVIAVFVFAYCPVTGNKLSKNIENILFATFLIALIVIIVCLVVWGEHKKIKSK